MGYKVHFVGWCFNEAKNNDKIWGFVEMDNGSLYNFWGKRGEGKTLTFQRHFGWWGENELQSRQRSKAKNKGYIEYGPRCRAGDYDAVMPGLLDHIEKQFTLAKFSGKIKDDDVDGQSFI